MKPRICILKAAGTNCDGETSTAFELAGGHPTLVHVNELRSGTHALRDFEVLALPGGFSYGDDVASGKILAIEFVSFLRDQLREFVNARRLVIGICNGFQVLVRTGLLPTRALGTMSATLAPNASGHFECRWVNLLVEPTNCVFTEGLERSILSFMVAHGEGRFVANADELGEIEDFGQIPLRYAHENQNLAGPEDYPANPNGSLNSIAGICDPTGRIFGLMPHPERFVRLEQHPNWRRSQFLFPHGRRIFENAVQYAAGL